MQDASIINLAGSADQGPRLSARKKKAIAAIIEAPNYEAAIPAAGVCRQTFYKWLRDPDFKAELDRRLDELAGGAIGRIKSAAGEAVEALRALLNSESETIRLRAAQGIIDYTLKARELDISARLDAIEDYIANGGK